MGYCSDESTEFQSTHQCPDPRHSLRLYDTESFINATSTALTNEDHNNSTSFSATKWISAASNNSIDTSYREKNGDNYKKIMPIKGATSISRETVDGLHSQWSFIPDVFHLTTNNPHSQLVDHSDMSQWVKTVYEKANEYSVLKYLGPISQLNARQNSQGPGITLNTGFLCP